MIGVTSGPGFGKTSVINELEKRGYTPAHEAARDLLADNVHQGSSLLEFERRVADTTVQRQVAAGKKGVVDRPVADVLAYLQVLGGIQAPNDLKALAVEHMPRRVYLLEPLPESLYRTDSERRETFDEALRLHNVISDTYERLGADVVDVPYFPADSAEKSIAKRADHLLENTPDDDGLERERLYRADHNELQEILKSYDLQSGQELETTRLYDIAGFFQKDGRRLRIRENGHHELTIKGGYRPGPSKSRTELSVRISKGLARLADNVLSLDVSYVNRTQWYVPTGDRTTSIHLDLVEGLGEFVEIEAPSEHQLNRWSDRLGLEHPIGEGYAEMIRHR